MCKSLFNKSSWGEKKRTSTLGAHTSQNPGTIQYTSRGEWVNGGISNQWNTINKKKLLTDAVM